MCVGVGQRLTGQPPTTGYRPLLVEPVLQMDESGNIVRGKSRGGGVVLHTKELFGLPISTGDTRLTLVIVETPNRPVQVIIEDVTTETYFILKLPMELVVGGLNQCEGRQIAVVGPVVSVGAITPDVLQAHRIGKLVIQGCGYPFLL